MGDRTDITSLRSGIDGTASPDSALLAGKSHMSTMKSLSLLHELQEYITALENIAASKTLELESLKQEKRSVEKVLLGKVKNLQRIDGAVFSQQLSDLPPKLRALLEDNRMLKDKLRKYKASTLGYERELKHLALKTRALEDQVQKLQQQLKACSVQPEDLTREDELAQEVAAKVHVIQNLEYKVKVLQQKQETDSRMFKQTLAERNREKEALLQQIESLKNQLEEKDRETREKMLEVKKLQRKLVPQRRTTDGQNTTPGPHNGACQTPMQQQQQQRCSATLDSNSNASFRSQLPDPEVKVILCVIRDEGPPPPLEDIDSFFLTQLNPSKLTAKSGPSSTMPEDLAAVKIQASFRGHAARKQVQLERERQEKAAVIIQAHARGMAARHNVKKRHTESILIQQAEPSTTHVQVSHPGTPEDGAAAKIQAFARGMKARGEVDRQKQEKAMAAARVNQPGNMRSTIARVETKSSRRANSLASSASMTDRGARVQLDVERTPSAIVHR